MPMTLSHPAAVLPLRRLGLPMTAMVIGSMVPDIPLFMGWTYGYSQTHSLIGLLTVDVAITLTLLALWFAMARDALVDLSPTPVRSRLLPCVRLSLRQWRLAPFGAAIGAATHVFWDAFTHPDRWGVRRVDWLRADHAGLSGMKWAQYVSGVLGLIIVGWAILSWLRAQPPIRPATPPRALSPMILYAVVCIAAATGLVSAARKSTAGLHAMAFNGVVDSLIALALGTALACVAWQVAVRHQLRETDVSAAKTQI